MNHNFLKKFSFLSNRKNDQFSFHSTVELADYCTRSFHRGHFSKISTVQARLGELKLGLLQPTNSPPHCKLNKIMEIRHHKIMRS